MENLLEHLLLIHGDPFKPIFPGAIFATLPPEEEFLSLIEESDMKYPPVSSNSPGCVFNAEDRTLKATVYGRVKLGDEGVLVSPCWQITNDNMLAVVVVNHTDYAGEVISRKRILKEMPPVLSELMPQMKLDDIDRALKKSKSTGQTYSVTLIEGKPAIPERPAELRLKFDTEKSVGTIREDGSIDFRERAGMTSVTIGDKLGTLHPPAPGIPGHDIFGTFIPPKSVPSPKIQTGEGVEATLNDDGSLSYVATKAGMARYRNQIIEITDLLEVDGDVDYKTGNIRARNGTVHIRGNVKSGFKVESDEDVIVDGLIEKADIRAGGLVISGGVIMDGSNYIKAEGDVSAHFFHNAFVESGGSVSADQDISHSTIIAAGDVNALGGKGIISGGHIISGTSITANIIGNKSGIKTIVEIRVRESAEDAIREAKKDIQNELREIDKVIGASFDLTSLMSIPEEDRRLVAELVKLRAKLKSEIRSIDESRAIILTEYREEIAKKHIRANDKVYTGTKAIICGVQFKPKNDMERTTFRLEPDNRTIEKI